MSSLSELLSIYKLSNNNYVMVTQNWENVNIWMRSQYSANELIRSVKFTPQASTFWWFLPSWWHYFGRLSTQNLAGRHRPSGWAQRHTSHVFLVYDYFVFWSVEIWGMSTTHSPNTLVSFSPTMKNEIWEKE